MTTLRNTDKDFNSLFPGAEVDKDFLLQFTGAVSEANYIDKAGEFFTSRSEFLKALEDIEKVEKFIRNHLPKVKDWRVFVTAVKDELAKSTKPNAHISQLAEEFDQHYSGNVVHHFTNLQQIAQKIKDEYHGIFSAAMQECASLYVELDKFANALNAEISRLPSGLNDVALARANAMSQYATQRMQPKISIEFDVKDKHSRFTYSEVLSFIELFNSKKTEIDILRAGLIREKAPDPVKGAPPLPSIKTYSTQLPARKIKVIIYKQWLQRELQKLASASDADEVEIKD